MTESQKWMSLALVTGLGILIYLLAPVLTPFMVAALLAYLGDPLVDRLEARKLGRTTSVVIVFSVIFLAIGIITLLIMPMLEAQLGYLVKALPGHIQWLQQEFLPAFASRIGLSPESVNLGALTELVRAEWGKTSHILLSLVKNISASGMVLAVWVGNMVLIPVVTFYLLRDWDILVARVDALLPRKQAPLVRVLSRESDEVLASFMRGQLLVMLALGTIYTLGLWMSGLKLALLIGMLAGLVSFVPYLGFIVGIVAAGVAMLLQTQDVMQLWPVVIVFGVGQALEGMLLTPWLVGDRIGLHPVAVIFAVLAGGQLFGFIGVLLALPVAAVIAVLLRHAHKHYLASELYEVAEKESDATSNRQGR